MNALDLLQFYFSWNFFFAILGIIFFGLSLFEKTFPIRPKASTVLTLVYTLISSFAIFWVLLLSVPDTKHTGAILEIFKAQEQGQLTLTLDSSFLDFGRLQLATFIPELFELINLAVFFLFLISFYFHVSAFLKIRSFFKTSRLMRKIGRVQLFYCEQMSEPFSFWNFKELCVFIPSYLLRDYQACRVVVSHELQHHRQGDTRWVYILTFLKVLCFWNFLLHYAFKKISEIQEFACDEVLVDQKRVPPRAYAGYLLQVAEEASLRLPACTTGFLTERSLLKRRIEKMVKINVHSKTATTLFSLVLSCGFFAAAWGAKGILQDKQLSLKQAQLLAKNAESEAFPLPVNEQVLESLNYFVGTEAGRERIKKSFERLEAYRPMVEKKLQEYGVPQELIVIPIVESGYQNLAPNNKVGWGAGLWMFIKTTAQNYGLKVDKQIDERLNEEMLTDAAMRYLNANWMRFKDWHLSTLAYNAGEGALQKWITQTQSRDALTLAAAGAESDKGYLSKVIAAAIVMKNPQLIE